MDLDQIRTAKHELEQQAGDILGKLIKEFEQTTTMTVQDLGVSIDTMGSTTRDLQRHYAPPTVRVTLEGI
jgi:hypothetical protein